MIIVTGGANGIGRAALELFRERGHAAWCWDREPAPGPSVEMDVRDIDAVRAALDEHGTPDAIVINAGLAYNVPILETTAEQWRHTLELNLTAAFLTLQEVARRMAVRRRGAIVLTASTNSFDGEADLIAYNASKAGLLGILHTAANELGPYGIRVNAVCPGFIRTRLTAPVFADPALSAPYFAQLPLGRGGEPREVAQAIAFLASGEASYITGASLFVDGGQQATKFATWNKHSGARFEQDRWVL
jgi:NAD(P)-dependent dehydrogenase (short-subunit alcohol dehydrogenase family)